MKKKIFGFILATSALFGLASCDKAEETTTGGATTSTTPATSEQTSTGSTSEEQTTDDDANYDYVIKVWCADAAVELTKKQCADFLAANTETFGGAKIKFNIQAQGEGDAASAMVTDVEAGADVFCFAQDQLARLVSAGALAKITEASDIEDINKNCCASATSASKVAGDLYAYPLTADNGYFMYYDKRVIKDSDIGNMTTLISACKTAEKTFYFELSGSAWYNAAFFFGAGCESTWHTNDDGFFDTYTDTYNSKQGIIAMKGISELVSETNVYVNGSSCDTAFSSGAAVCVSGTWDYNAAQKLLGENMGCAMLPKYTVDGVDYQLGSFTGCKLLGVKPQEDGGKLAICQLLSLYLISEKCQNERFAELAWGPSNKASQQTPEVLANAAQVAINAQNAYATIQGQYPGDWWTAGASIVSSLIDKKDFSEANIKSILKEYAAKADSFLNA